MKQFRIEIADGDQGRFFDINPLSSGRYEIFVDGKRLERFSSMKKITHIAKARVVNSICLS